jgi:large subunit ribosomal protein L13
MKTYQPKAKDVTRNWHLVDLEGKVLGRSATEIARLLMGKHKPTYANHMDMGDYVIVVNAKDVILTGKKEKQKVYQSHSGFAKGFKEVKFADLKAKDPAKIIFFAVSRMLPKNRLQSGRLKRMKVFAGKEHTFQDKLPKA